jgi:hypothetical protein
MVAADQPLSDLRAWEQVRRDSRTSSLWNRRPGLVAKAFELVHAGIDRPADVLRTMTDMGLRSKKGNKLKLSSFLKMLRNPVYIGMVRSKKWRKVRPGLHQPIVDKRTFDDVQLILKDCCSVQTQPFRVSLASFLALQPMWYLADWRPVEKCNRQDIRLLPLLQVPCC